MALDERGKVAAAEIVFYVPVLCIAFFIALKHGFTRRAGWVFLFTFSLVRIVGAAITVVEKTQSNPANGLTTAASVLSGLGLAPLLLATQSFVKTIADRGVAIPPRILNLTRILLTVGVILAVVGSTKQSPDSTPSELSTGRTLLRVGIMLFVATYALLFALHVRLWMDRQNILSHHRTLLSGVSLALPFLFVRLLYAVLGAFASSFQSRFSSIAGDWKIYLAMGLIMEYIVVCVYVITGVIVPLDKDEEPHTRGMPTVTYQAPQDSRLEMGKPRYAYAG